MDLVIAKYYPNDTKKEYFPKKIVVNFMNEHDIPFSEEMLALLNGKEEDNSLFKMQVIEYMGIAKNRVNVVQWTMDYGICK
jgi:hypothetical protein